MKSFRNSRSFGFLALCFLALALLVPDIVSAASYISIAKTIRSDFDNSIDLTTADPNDGSRDVVFRVTITNTGTSGVYVHSTDDLGNGQFYSADPGAPYDRDNIWVPAHSNYVYDFRARYQGSNTTHGAAITSTARIIWIDGCYNYPLGIDCGVHGNLTSSRTAYIHNPNQSPTARVTMTSGGQTAYENQTLNLSVSAGGTAQVSFSASRSSDPDGSISSYVWKISGTQVSTSRDFSFSLGKGTHQIYLTVTDNQGAQGSVGASIIVTEQINPSPTAGITMTSGGQTAYENQTLNLSVSAGGTAQVSFSASRSSDPDGSISSYVWKISGTQVSTSRDFSFSLGKGTHQIYLTVTDNQGAQGSVRASIVIEETTITTSTTTPTTTTSATTSTTATTTISSTTSTSTTSTLTSTTSTTTTTLPIPSRITTIDIPDIMEEGELSSSNAWDLYRFTLLSQSDTTVTLISTDFDTCLFLYTKDGVTLLGENDNAKEVFGNFSTNSQISMRLPEGTYFIWVESRSGSGKYTLVLRDIGDNDTESICGWREQMYPAVYPRPSWDVTQNDWAAEWKRLGGDDTIGRCGKGNLDGFVDCLDTYKYTRDCLNHDACVKQHGHVHCRVLLTNCVDDCLHADDCGGPYHIDPYLGSCGGETPCYSTIREGVNAADSGTTIKVLRGSYDEDVRLSTSRNLILKGGWDATYSSQTSTSTINSMTITDGTIIVDRVVIK